MKISVEHLLKHTSDVYEVGRIPCVGEMVCLDDDCYNVVSVMHILDANAETQVLAIVRVK